MSEATGDEYIEDVYISKCNENYMNFVSAFSFSTFMCSLIEKSQNRKVAELLIAVLAAKYVEVMKNNNAIVDYIESNPKSYTYGYRLKR